MLSDQKGNLKINIPTAKGKMRGEIVERKGDGYISY